MKNNPIFTSLIATRIVSPPIVFSIFHPFIAMLLNEVVLDGMISPYHFFSAYIPDHVKNFKLDYDSPLDMWGFLTAMLPVLYKGNKFYSIFEGYRSLLTMAIVWRFVGYIVAYKTRSWKWFLVFQNFFISLYLAIGFCDFFKIKKNQQEIMYVSILIFILREFYLVYLNWRI